MASIPHSPQSAGIPGSWTENLTRTYNDLFTGTEPKEFGEDMLVEASTSISALQVVGVNGNGRLVPAVSGTVAALGVAKVAITTDASTTYKYIQVIRSGVLNPNALVWDASYSTDALKFNAFRGAPSPTQIIVRRPKSASV